VTGSEPASDAAGNAFERVPTGGSASPAGVSPIVLAIAAHKGGVGKTTTAISLAAGLARIRGASVLLVDLDPQGHAAKGLDREVPWSQPVFNAEHAAGLSARDLFLEPPAPLVSCERTTDVPGLTIVPSNIGLERVAQWLHARPRREGRLAERIQDVRGYHWIVLDCPPSLGPLVENALCAAHFVIVPCRMEARAADGLVDLVDVLHMLRPGFDRWRILRTQRDARASKTNEAIDAVLAEYSSRLLQTVIPKSEALNQSQIVRQDIFEYDKQSAGAVAYSMLCGEVEAWVKISQVVDEAAESGSA